MLNTSNIIIFLIGILLNVIIFNILYSRLNSNDGYLKKVLIYTIGMEIKQIIITGIIVRPVLILILRNYLLLLLAIYFVLGLALISLLNKLYSDRITFVITGVLIQFGISSLAYLLLNLFI